MVPLKNIFINPDNTLHLSKKISFNNFFYFSIAILLILLSIDILRLNNKLIYSKLNTFFSSFIIDDFYKTNTSYQDIGVKLRRLIGLDQKVLYLGTPSNNLGRGWLLGAGIQSEVSYSLGINWHRIAFGSVEESVKELKALNINYFIIDIKTASIGGIIYSDLFSTENMIKNFKCIESSGDMRVLTFLDNEKNLENKCSLDFPNWESIRVSPSSYNNLYSALREKYFVWGEHIVSKPNIESARAVVKGWQ
jgi:hypothetical protein